MNYRDAQHLYLEAGWPGVLPLPARAKFPPPEGFTGRGAPYPDEAQLEAWRDGPGDGNLCLRLPEGVLGIDVDAYDGKPGAETLMALEARLGKLPPTFRSSARPYPSGIRFFRVPPGRAWRDPGPGLEVVHAGWRYAVGWPSIHPNGSLYDWFLADEDISVELPAPQDLDWLPEAWVRYLDAGEARPYVSSDVDVTWLTEVAPIDPEGWEPCRIMADSASRHMDNLLTGGASRHDSMISGVKAVVRLAVHGHRGGLQAVERLREAFEQTVTDRSTWGEFNRALTGALQKEGASLLVQAPPCRCGAPTPLATSVDTGPVPDDLSEDAPVDWYERQVEVKVRDLRIMEDARHRLAVERQGDTGPPQLLTLKERLALPRSPVTWRIEGWQPAGSRVVLAAQFKAGKTTLRDNLVRCLADGDEWLNQYPVTPITGTVAVLDFEMSGNQMDDWLRAQGIKNDDKVLVEPLRGRATSFDLLDDRVLKQWAKWLREREVGYVALDCLRPILDALGLDENRDAGRFLVAFEQLLTEAEVGEATVVHHMGHDGERSRGDSRIRDWPDVEWKLVRLDDDPASARFISAYGRDVDQVETQLVYIPDIRRLNLAGGSRSDEHASRALKVVLGVLDEAEEPLSVRAIQDAVLDSGSEQPQKAVRAAIKLGRKLGVISMKLGPNRAHLHTRVKAQTV